MDGEGPRGGAGQARDPGRSPKISRSESAARMGPEQHCASCVARMGPELRRADGPELRCADGAGAWARGRGGYQRPVSQRLPPWPVSEGWRRAEVGSFPGESRAHRAPPTSTALLTPRTTPPVL